MKKFDILIWSLILILLIISILIIYKLKADGLNKIDSPLNYEIIKGFAMQDDNGDIQLAEDSSMKDLRTGIVIYTGEKSELP